jgi:hypothetical protein
MVSGARAADTDGAGPVLEIIEPLRIIKLGYFLVKV